MTSVLFDTLPATAESVGTWPWSRIVPYYEDLLARPLSAETISDWLRDWSRIGSLIDEAGVRFTIATTTNTADAQAESEYTAFLQQILPEVLAVEQRVTQKLLESGLGPSGFGVALRELRTDAALFRPENSVLLAEERRLSLEYDKISGAQTVLWEGKDVPLVQVYPVLQETDRERRERAWRAIQSRYLEDTPSWAALWRSLLTTRQNIAENAGYPSYREYRWQQLHRFDYTLEDAKRFDEAIAEVVVPAANRVQQRRRDRLGLATLRPWDEKCDPDGLPPLHPYQTLDELQDGVERIFAQVSPRFAAYFATMRRERLLDLESRDHKASGGYQLELAAVRKPFIFTVAVGTQRDVETLLHEGGHAFHVYETAPLPYLQQHSEQMLPTEFAEVASIAMEFLGSPYLAASRGGFYSEAEAARARIEHLEGVITFLPYMAMIDSLQHWVYEHPEAAKDLSAVDDVWLRLVDSYDPVTDWSGLEREKRGFWHRQSHVFQDPLYYIEYGIAYMGAIQVFANARRDQKSAVEAYRRALALGNTAPLPELFAAAGARFAFDAPTLHSTIQVLEEVAAELEPIARR